MPSTMFITRSTSPPKSAWPGVSTMLILTCSLRDRIPDDDRGVLGEDRDPALAFQVVGIHHPFGDLLVFPEGVGLPQQAVDQRGFAVVDMRDDGDIPNVRPFFFHIPTAS